MELAFGLLFRSTMSRPMASMFKPIMFKPIMSKPIPFKPIMCKPALRSSLELDQNVEVDKLFVAA